MVRYPGGQTVPGNVLSAIKFVAKVGAFSTAQWHSHFGRGSFIGQQKQLKRLRDRRIIKKHRNSDEAKWVLDYYGEQILKRLKLDPVPPVASQHLQHDELIGNSFLEFEKSGYTNNWETEKELKISKSRIFVIRGKNNEIKYPDGIFQVKVKGQMVTIALEYERTGKTYSRYKNILMQYEALSNIELVIFICEDQSIKNRILKALKDIGGQRLQSRLGVVDVELWKNNPILAPIQIGQKRIRLGDVCATI